MKRTAMSELIFRRILERARLFADQDALLDLGTGHAVSYGEHLARVERLTAVIRALGLGPGDRLGVLAGASHVYVELWQAALSGAAVINPLNSRLAAEEIVYILNDSETEVIFVDAEFAPMIASIRERLPALRRVVLIGKGDVPHDDRLDDLMSAVEPALPSVEPEERAPAVLMYTGGTTGLPKGVVLSQRGLALQVYRMQAAIRPAPGEVFLSVMPLFHIGGMSAWGFFLPSGGKTVLLPAFEPGLANRAIRDHRIRTIGAVPTMLAMMLEHPEFEPGMLDSLRRVIYGAAPMPPELLDRFLKTFPQIGFLQVYGMTECCASVTALLPEDHQPESPVLRSVGRACLGVELEIRDPETTRPLAQGETGEIWIRCGSMLTAYWKKKAQTEASIVDGWYRSGDAGRLDERGYLFLADRVKDMIVTGGENVYSIEVENAISSHPAVTQVAVVGAPHPTWSEVVHAFVVCEPGAVSGEELAAHARKSIAGFKVPKGWTFQSEPLPLSAAGKILKKELRERLTSKEPETGCVSGLLRN
jgi:acyl-CoA synthetase (AMP-forming)/AMP-acid ligase II